MRRTYFRLYVLILLFINFAVILSTLYVMSKQETVVYSVVSKEPTLIYFQDGSRCVEGIHINARNESVINTGATYYLSPINYCPALVAVMKDLK